MSSLWISVHLRVLFFWDQSQRHSRCHYCALPTPTSSAIQTLPYKPCPRSPDLHDYLALSDHHGDTYAPLSRRSRLTLHPINRRWLVWGNHPLFCPLWLPRARNSRKVSNSCLLLLVTLLKPLELSGSPSIWLVHQLPRFDPIRLDDQAVFQYKEHNILSKSTILIISLFKEKTTRWYVLVEWKILGLYVTYNLR